MAMGFINHIAISFIFLFEFYIFLQLYNILLILPTIYFNHKLNKYIGNVLERNYKMVTILYFLFENDYVDKKSVIRLCEKEILHI